MTGRIELPSYPQIQVSAVLSVAPGAKVEYMTITWTFHQQNIGEATHEIFPPPGDYQWGDACDTESLLPWPGPEATDETQRLIYAAGRLLVEGLTGRRPFSQLARWLPANTLNRLQLLSHRGTWTQAKIRRTMGSQSAPGTIHAVVLIDNSSRIVAATLRLRQVNTSWRCERADLLWAGSHLSALDPSRASSDCVRDSS
jgi:hypothetical protein